MAQEDHFGRFGNIENPDLAEFANWVPAHEVLEVFPDLAPGVAVRSILQNIRSGMLVTAAATVSWEGYRGPIQRHLKTIPAEWWSRVENIKSHHHDFWTTGQFEAWIGPPPDIRRNLSLHDFLDVRFEWGRLYAMPHAQKRVPILELVAYFAEGVTLASAASKANPAIATHPPEAWQQEVDRVGAGPGVTEAYVLYGGDEKTLGRIMTDAAIAKIASAEGPKALAQANQGGVAHGEIVAWFEGLTPEQQQLSGKKLWVLSRPAFDPRRVLRKQFDWLTETRAPGPRKAK